MNTGDRRSEKKDYTMKKVLYMNLLYDNVGAKYLDENIIESLSKYYDVTVAYPNGGYTRLPSNIQEYKFRYLFKNANTSYLELLIETLHLLQIAIKLDKKLGFDYLFFASYETYTFCLSFLFKNRGKRVFIIENNNIDLTEQNRFKPFFYNLYTRKVNHVVLDEFIVPHLLKRYRIPKDKVFFISHPVNELAGFENEKKYDVVGISNSNNQELISQFIEQEKKLGTVKNEKLTVILRSSREEYDNGYLKVFKGYLPHEIYDQYIKNAKIIYLPFPKSFRYRMSGSLVDAFSNNIKIIGSKIPIFLYYEKKYPHICKTIDSADKFMDALHTLNRVDKDSISEFSDFRTSHSKEKLDDTLTSIFGI